MHERTRKRQDLNRLAADIVAEATDTEPEADAAPASPPKNPNAVALGRLGGMKGGKARAAKLTAERRSEIARRAAQARWGSRA